MSALTADRSVPGLARWLGGRFRTRSDPGRPINAARPRLKLEVEPGCIYAIGDVHGCLDELRSVESNIVADAAETSGEKWIVMLGDYVDRGPKSAQVLDHLLAAPPDGFRRICLAGNHEEAMLEFCRDPVRGGAWLSFGGDATLRSYGLRLEEIQFDTSNGRRLLKMMVERIPTEHLNFIATLPVSLLTPDYLFVHAGIVPGRPVDAQNDHDLLWSGAPDADVDPGIEQIVVHGHWPTERPSLSGRAINIDTGAFMTGRLTALRIAQDSSLFLLSS